MERTQCSRNLLLCMSPVPAAAEEHPQCTNTPEARVEATSRTPTTGEVASVGCPTQHAVDSGWRWATAPVPPLGTISALNTGNCGGNAVSPAALSSGASNREELLYGEQRGITTTAGNGAPGLQLCRGSNTGVSTDEPGCIPPCNSISAIQASTVSPRDFMSSPAAGSVTGLGPLWGSVDTPTGAATAAGSDGRGPSFTRPLQYSALCSVISSKHLGGVPLLQAGGCELANTSMESVHQQSSAVSPDPDTTQKKFFFSAPFMTPPDPSGGAATKGGGLCRSLASVSGAGQCISAAGSPTVAELTAAAGAGSGVAAAAGEMHLDKIHIDTLTRAVTGSDRVTQDSLMLQLQAGSLLTESAPEVAAAEGRGLTVAAPADGALGLPTDAAAAAAVGGEGDLCAEAATSSAAVSLTAGVSQSGRLQRGMRPAAKSAILRCTNSNSSGAAAVIPAAVVQRKPVFGSAFQRNRNTVAFTVGASATTNLQQTLLSLPAHPAAVVEEGPHKAAAHGALTAAALAGLNTAIDSPASIERRETNSTTRFSDPSAAVIGADVACSTDTGGGTPESGAAETALLNKKSEGVVLQAIAGKAEAVSLKSVSGRDDSSSGERGNTDACHDRQKASRSSGEALQQKRRRASARGVPSTAVAAPTADSAPVASTSLKKKTPTVIRGLYARDGSGARSNTGQLHHPRVSHQYGKSRPSCIILNRTTSSPQGLQSMRRLRAEGGAGTGVISRMSVHGLTARGSGAGKYKKLRMKRCHLRSKRTLTGGRCSSEVTCAPISSFSSNAKVRRRRSGTSGAAAAAEKYRNDSHSTGSSDACAASLASALCEIKDDDEPLESGGNSLGSTHDGPITTTNRRASAGATLVASSSTMPHPEECAGRKHGGNSRPRGLATGSAACPVISSQREKLQHLQQHAFHRRSGAGTSSSCRGCAKTTASSGSGGTTGGSLSARVRALVEKAMMTKHKIVWIERSEAKGFLPLPGMQEEKVYLVWTEKGIDVLVDMQAYIPWTHCPILMPAKHRRLHIPLLILSSTSLSMLFSHVCRRTATSVFRLPLTRTPPAYRRSMLQMLRGEKYEQRQEEDEEFRPQQKKLEQQHWGNVQKQQSDSQVRTVEISDRFGAEAPRNTSERWKRKAPPCVGRAVKVSRGGENSSRDGTHVSDDSSRSSAKGEPFTESGGPARQCFSPRSTSASCSTGPSALPSPSATDTAEAAISSAASASTSRAEYVSAALVVLSSSVVRAGSDGAPTTTKEKLENITEPQQCGKRGLEGNETERSTEQNSSLANGEQSNQECDTSTESAGDNHSCETTVGARRVKDSVYLRATSRNSHATAGGHCRASSNDEITPEENFTEDVPEQMRETQAEERGDFFESRSDSDNLPGGESDAAAGGKMNLDSAKEAAATETKTPGGDSDGAAKQVYNLTVSTAQSCVKAESGLKHHERSVETPQENGKCVLLTSSSVHMSVKDSLTAVGGRADPDRESMGGAESGKRKVELDMKDFYSCSQGKVVGEDYIYFRQMLPDDEGADVYDISVNVKKRPKKTFVKKPRLPALWSVLAKRHQLLCQGGITAAVTSDQQSIGLKVEMEQCAAARPPQGSEHADVGATQGDVVAVEGVTRIASAAGDASGTGSAVTEEAPTEQPVVGKTKAAMEFTTEELLNMLAKPEEATDSSADLETTNASGEAGEEEDERKQAWRGSKWAYVEEYGDEGVDERLSVPLVFVTEMRVLLGVAASPTPHRCNMSLASHRVSGAVQRRVRMFLCDGENRGQEIDVYAQDCVLTRRTAQPDCANEAAHQDSQECSNGSAGELRPRATAASEPLHLREETRERVGKNIQRDVESSECDGVGGNRRLFEKETSVSGNVAAPPEERKMCTSVTEFRTEERAFLGEVDSTEEGRTTEGIAGDVSEKSDGVLLTNKAPREDVTVDGREPAEADEKALPDNVTAAEDGTLVEVEFPTEFLQYRESDRVRIYGKAFLTRALQILADVSGLCRGADLSAVNLAQYAPNLFWNVVRFSSHREDVDEVLKDLCPAVALLRRRRKRLDGAGETRGRRIGQERNESVNMQQRAPPGDASIAASGIAHATGGSGRKVVNDQRETRGDLAKSINYGCLLTTAQGDRPVCTAMRSVARQLQREERRQQELELRFQEMKIEFDERAKRILARKDALKDNMFTKVKWLKKSRLPAVPENDDEALIKAVIDLEGGVLKWPLSALTVRQKNVIYQACLKRDLTACICLTRVPGKGRAVFAADRILKDDFVVEYKGELCSEREAREREQRYNRSKVPMGGEELLVDYGERDPEVIREHPWLNN